MSAAGRAERLAERVAERDLDALIVGDLVRPGDSGPDAIANVRWLTGFTGTSALAIVGPEERLFLTDFRYTERAEREVHESFERARVEGRMVAELAKRLHGRVGFDDMTTSVHWLRRLEEEAGEGVELVPVQGIVEDMRRTKDGGEVEAIAEASRLADDVFEWTAERGLAGRTEADVARAAEARMRELGAEPSFPAIVAAGPNGAQPHAEPGERPIGPGELVVIDMGAKLDGYCSDGTRTFASGEPGDEAREVYELVLASQLASLDALRAGIGGAEADAVSREPIEAAVTPRSRALVLTNPNNPDGHLPSRAEVDALLALASRHGLTVVTDEAYERCIHEGELASAWGAPNVILIRSLGKSLAMPAWRIGFVAAEASFVDRCLAELEWDVIRVGHVAQRAATAALDGPQDWLQEVAAGYRRDRDAAHAWVTEHPALNAALPAATPFLWLDLGGLSPADLIADGLPVVDGAAFGAPGHARLPFAGFA